jgi:ATP-dependent Lhr-like helicase
MKSDQSIITSRSAASWQSGVSLFLDWFAQHGWQPFPFQREAWAAFGNGESGLIHSATGTGKSYAALMGPLMDWVNQHSDKAQWKEVKPPGLTVLWITPLRALAADTEESVTLPINELGIPWTVGRRTGDTSSSQRQKQKTHLPSLLITTPESLSLQLSYADAPEKFRYLQAVIVDEWHELMGSKRGTMTELCLAHLRSWQPALHVWGLSATIGNLDVAMNCLLGSQTGKARLIEGNLPKRYQIESLIPEAIERFPWSGHIGLKMLPQVIEAIEQANSTLVFTNVRSQCEIWYQAMIEARPDWAGLVAIHHGSLDREVREWVENSLREGKLLAVVCTSSLDLGVDFSPVDQVIQVGSPKGVARMLQRAGRSGHQPGAISRLLCSPTNAFELIEFAATRRSIEKSLNGDHEHSHIESRIPISKPLDLLVQHLVTIGVGTGFEPNQMLDEIRSTYAYRTLTDEEWQWALDFLTHGGKTLQAYDQYRKLVPVDGTYRVTDQTIAKRHRMSIGTITSDASLIVKYVSGGTLGTVEENFVARLKKGDTFTFAGRTLEFVRLREMTVQVRRAKDSKAAIPRWMGGRIPLSSELAEAMLEVLTEYRAGVVEDPEIRVLAPILEIQDRWSKVPTEGELVIERLTTREGHHLFFYPFAGRLANDGLAALFALRLSRLQPITFTTAANDYGCELLSDQPLETELDEAMMRRLLSIDQLDEDIAASLNSVEMARRQFREISRVAGLVFQGYPGQGKTNKQLQASSGLLYDVFVRFEPDSLLLKQAHQEVLSRQLEQHRLRATLVRLQQSRIVINPVARPTPFAFPLLVDHLREKLSSEKLADRIKRMQIALEKEVEVERGRPVRKI